MDVTDKRTIEKLRARLDAADTPAEHARAAADLGIALADRHLRSGFDKSATPRMPLSREILDEILALFDAADGTRGAEIEIRDACLRSIRFMTCDGPLEDRERAIAAFRGVLSRADAPTWQREFAHLQLGFLLVIRYLPLGLRSMASPNLDVLLKLMNGFEGVGPDAVPDLNEALEHLRHVNSSELWPPDIAGYAAVLTPLVMLLLPGTDLMRLPALLGAALQRLPADAFGGPEVAAMRAWLAIEAAQKKDDPAEVAAAITEADAQTARLPEGHVFRAPLQFEKGMALLREGPRGIEQALAAFAQALADTSEDHPFRQIAHNAFGGALVTAVAKDPGRGDEPGGDVFIDVDRAVRHAREVVAAQERRAAGGDPEERNSLGRDRFLLGMALLLRAYESGRDEDFQAGRDELDEALLVMDRDDELYPALMGMYGALLHNLHLTHGALQHADLAEEFFREAETTLGPRAGAGVRAWDDMSFMRGIAAISRVTHARRRREAEPIASAADVLHDVVDGLPQDDPLRPFLLGGLAMAHADHGQLTGDLSEVSLGIGYLVEAAEALPPEETAHHHYIRGMAAVASLAQGLLDGDRDAIRRAVPRLERAVRSAIFGAVHRVNLLNALAFALALRYEYGLGDRADLETAVQRLDEAVALLEDGPSDRIATEVYTRQAEVYRLLDRRDEAADAGLAALRARTIEVLLQTTPEHGLHAARDGADHAHEVALWCLDDDRPDRAVTALELGRGLVLHSATVTAGVPELLTAEGETETAERWRQAVGAAPATAPSGTGTAEDAAIGLLLDGFMGGEAPADLRRRVITVLRRSARNDRLFSAPPPAEIGAALSRAGAHALVYLLPGKEQGWAVIVEATGRTSSLPLPGLGADGSTPLREYAAALTRLSAPRDERNRVPAEADAPGGDNASEARDAWERALGALCDWAWPGIMESVHRTCEPRAEGTTPRVVLVPCGMLGLVPWHAARYPAGGDGRYRYACEDLVVSYAATARQFIDSVGRAREDLEWGAPVLVSRPLTKFGYGDDGLLGAAFEVAAIHDAFYPDATVLGRAYGAESGAGTPDEVLTALTSTTERPALFHCATHAVTGNPPSDSELLLAAEEGDDGTLKVARVIAEAESGHDAIPCELVVLSSCLSDLTSDAYDEALTIATAFMAAGAANVVGSRWAVLDGPSAVLMFMFHHHLVTDRLPVADALRAAQVWMLDPGRRAPDAMPLRIRRIMELGKRSLDDPVVWAAFTHHGGGAVSFTVT